MAENKKSFVLYVDQKGIFDKLSDDQAGKLIKHIFSYVSDESPESDFVTELAFESIKQQLKRDLRKYTTKKSEAGAAGNLKRWNPDIYKRVLSGEITLSKGVEIAKDRKVSQNVASGRTESQTVAKVAVNDNVTDTVNVTVTDIVINKEKKTRFNFRKALENYGFEIALVDEWIRIRKAKKAVNSEHAFKKIITEVEKTARPPNEVLKIAVDKQWRGIESEWIKNLENGTTTNRQNNQAGGTQRVATNFNTPI